VHGRDGVPVVPHVLLEQLVDPTVRYRSPRAGEPFERWRSPRRAHPGHRQRRPDGAAVGSHRPDPATPARRPLTGHTDDVYAVAFVRDGHTLATASGDQTVLLWDLSGLQKGQSNPIGRACSLTGRGLNADEWGVVAPDVPYGWTLARPDPPAARCVGSGPNAPSSSARDAGASRRSQANWSA
jgi:hypothetical protein